MSVSVFEATLSFHLYYFTRDLYMQLTRRIDDSRGVRGRPITPRSGVYLAPQLFFIAFNITHCFLQLIKESEPSVIV